MLYFIALYCTVLYGGILFYILFGINYTRYECHISHTILIPPIIQILQKDTQIYVSGSRFQVSSCELPPRQPHGEFREASPGLGAKK